MQSGNVTLSPGQSGSVSVSRHLKWNENKPAYSETWSGDVLRITATCPSQPQCSIDYTVNVPASVAVHVNTTAGDVTVDDLTGGVDLRVAGGDVSLNAVKGLIDVGCDTGAVTGRDLMATNATVRNSVGDVKLTFATVPDAVIATTRTGAVDVTVPPGGSSGYKVQADTDVGRRMVTVTEGSDSSHTITATTSTGDVTVD